MTSARLPQRTTQNVRGFQRFILPLPDFCLDIWNQLSLERWLMKHPLIADNMIWESATGLVAYPNWPDAQKDQLRRAFPFAYPFQMVDPPTNMLTLADNEFARTILSPDQAWQMYLNHLAQILANDFWGAFPWSLSDYEG